MSKRWCLIDALFIALLVSCAAAFASTLVHEQAHQVITNYFSGITPEVHFYFSLNHVGAYTDPVEYPSPELQNMAYQGHAVNEAGYQFMPWLFAITFVLTFGTSYYVLRDFEANPYSR